MANIILPKYKEVFVESQTLVKGKWKVEIVHPNGEVSQPLGDKMRPNLIQDGGIRFLCGHDRTAFSFDGTTSGINHARGIADVISHAFYSAASANPTATNYRGNLLGTDASASYSSVNTTNTCTRVNTANGCVFTKVWDFQAVQTGQHTVREIAIGTRGSSGGENNPVAGSASTGERGYGRPSGFVVFSRFVLPANVTIDTYQFLRLTYTLEISIPATVTPIDVPEIVSGTFSTRGKIKCMGSFGRIFGDMNPDGSVIQRFYTVIGSTNMTARNPWALIGNTELNGIANTTNLAAAALMGADDEFGNGALAITDYDTNVDLPLSLGSTKSATKMLTHQDIGGSITNDPYTAGSNSCSKSAAIFFPATIPNISRWIGGLFFTSQIQRIGSAGTIGTQGDPFTIGIDGASRGICSGWLYNFYDNAGNRRAQFKDINFALRFNYTQTVTR